MALFPLLRRFHRWHALLMSLIVVMAAGSGLLHTLMSRSQPPPPASRPGAALDLSTVTLPPSAIAGRLPAGAGPVVSASLRSIGGQAWWQVHARDRAAPFYLDGRDGTLDDGADERYAAAIASAHLGGKALRKTAYLTAFDSEYIAIFRVLPVHRFDCDDGRGTRVYVSTLTGSVTRHTDDSRQFEASTFSLLHKWTFIPNRDLRDAVIIAAMTGLLLLAGSGVVLFILGRPRSRATPPDRP